MMVIGIFDVSISRMLMLATGLLGGLMLASAALASEPLRLEATISLEDVVGRIDHMAVDLKNHRLIIAEPGNNSVDVVDLESHRRIYRIAALHEPQGVASAPAAQMIVVATGGDGSVRFYRSTDLAPLGFLFLGDDADNVRVDGHTGNVVVGYGQGGLAVIDPESRAKIGDIHLGAHPESFQLTRDGRRAFVNVPGAGKIEVVTKGQQTASWSVPHLAANFPLALDASEASIAVVFRSPPRLVELDAQNGAVRASVETCGDADDVFFDETRKRIYVSCGAGLIDVFDASRPEPQRIASVATASGARASLFVPELDRLFVAGKGSSLKGGAKVWVYRPV